MAKDTIVVAVNEKGDAVNCFVYDDSKDGSGRLDLLIPSVDAQTNAVTWRHSPRMTLGKDCVLPGEDTSILGKAERDHFNQGVVSLPVTQDVSEGQEVNAGSGGVATPTGPATATPAQETWQRLGFASRQAWKDAGKPQN